MSRPYTNMKNYEEMLRERVKCDPILKLPKMEIYKKILKTIDKDYEKSAKRTKGLSDQRDVVAKLIFEGKDKFTAKIELASKKNKVKK